MHAVKGEHGECGKGLMDSELYASWCWGAGAGGRLVLGRLVLGCWSWWTAGVGAVGAETEGAGALELVLRRKVLGRWCWVGGGSC